MAGPEARKAQVFLLVKERVELIGPELDVRRRAAMTSELDPENETGD